MDRHGTSGSWSRPQPAGGGTVVRVVPLEHALNPLNPTFQIEIDVPSGTTKQGSSPSWVLPVTLEPLAHGGDCLYSDGGGVAYPSVGGIPVLRAESAVHRDTDLDPQFEDPLPNIPAVPLFPSLEGRLRTCSTARPSSSPAARGRSGRSFVENALSNHAPKRIIVFSRDELKQHDMQLAFPRPAAFSFFIGDVARQVPARARVRGRRRHRRPRSRDEAGAGV